MKEKKAEIISRQLKSTYDNIADEFSESRNYIGKEFPKFLTYLKGKIVDLGCGNGRFAGFIEQNKDLKCEYIGIDNNESFIKIAKEKYPSQKFILGDQLKIPLQENTVDVLVNIRAFHHIPSKKLRLKALKEMKKVLKPDGTLIISVWNIWQKKYRKQLIAAIARSIFTLGSYEYNDTFIPWNKKEKRYYHAFTRKEIKKIVQQSGFTIIEFLEVHHDFIIIAKNG